MTKSNKKQVMAYLSEDDKDKLAALAKADNRSLSSWIVCQVRAEYSKTFGSADPKELCK